MKQPRRFLRPWTVIEHDESFEVPDGTGTHLAFVQFGEAPTRQSMMRRLSKDSARRMAAQMVRWPELIRINGEA